MQATTIAMLHRYAFIGHIEILIYLLPRNCNCLQLDGTIAALQKMYPIVVGSIGLVSQLVGGCSENDQ